METCIVCSDQTSKYKCPKCFSRYCSVSCCKKHKESCQQEPTPPAPEPPKEPQIASVPNYPLWTGVHNEAFLQDMAVDEDTVPAKLLGQLRDNEEMRSSLDNPHLRAMMENLVNSDHPTLNMAQAMQEPIFIEFADRCLQIVDKDNRNLEPEGGGTAGHWLLTLALQRAPLGTELTQVMPFLLYAGKVKLTRS